METGSVEIAKLPAKARHLADGVKDEVTRERLLGAAADYDQRAKEVEMDDTTGQ